MSARGSQASQPMLCLEVLEACMIGSILSHGSSRLADLPSFLAVCLEVLEACMVLRDVVAFMFEAHRLLQPDCV